MTLDLELWLQEAIRFDPIYQQMLAEVLSLEEEYSRILSELNDRDRATLEQYITLSEEMEHRQTQLLAEKIFTKL